MSDHLQQTERHVGRAEGAWRRVFVVTASYVLIGACLSSMSVAAMANEPTADPLHAAPLPADDLTPARLLDDLESTGREKQARLNRIRLQLQKLAEASRSTAPAGGPAVPPAPPPPPPPLDEFPPAPQLETNVHEARGPLTDPHAVPAPPDERHTPDHSTTPTARLVEHHSSAARDAGEKLIAPADGHANPLPHATETLAGASIDRIALADSLFGNGQSDLALQAYGSIDLLKQPVADRYWIEYQIANCHRRLGNLAEAQQRYRRLAGLVDAGWCAAHARWWLDALNTRETLQRDLSTISATLETVEEQLNAKPKQ